MSESQEIEWVLASAAHLLKLEQYREKISMAPKQEWLADLWSVSYFFESQIKLIWQHILNL